MSNVIMYSTGFCPYCVRARQLLKHKGIDFEEIRVDVETERRAEMEQRSGRTSVPQIFIDDFHVGGCDELYALERAGELDKHLGLTDTIS